MGWFPSKQERLDKKLWKAVREHDLRRVADLLAEGANPNVRNAKGETPLFVAVGSEMDDMLYDTYGSRNPSCYEANSDLARILIEAGADIHILDNNGKSVLITACFSQHTNVTRLILAHNPDVTVRTQDTGYTAFHAIAYTNAPDVLKIAETLIERGADINAANNEGSTPLHLTACCDNKPLAYFLVSAGADPAKPDKSGQPPGASGRYFYAPSTAIYLQSLRGEITPAPETPAADNATTGWELAATDIVTCVTPDTAGYRLTEIFNFGRSTYTQISRNLETHQETQIVRLFDEFNDKSFLDLAYSKLIENGGQAVAPVSHHNRLNKKAL